MHSNHAAKKLSARDRLICAIKRVAFCDQRSPLPGTHSSHRRLDYAVNE
jgi:hypothetical protein